MGILNLGASGVITSTELSIGVVPCFSARAGGTNPFTTNGTTSPYTPVSYTHLTLPTILRV